MNPLIHNPQMRFMCEFMDEITNNFFTDNINALV